ncbi:MULTISPECIES: toxic anion resistance protein [Pontibacillus]|uniref:Toxic anion resistance protein n=1 Tax=Pontibacillus chungwhensis TaxID=265426 RepID=A0ABY8V171_9BACI|nr:MULTISPECIES: toxic anion resistance protein [Pontibacillus]MCD5324323.1 toxic anion resistance protein [Pontibacillus sp. HN14]WIF99380.1 toxic anion resistance protein [Pontibacillus chungwhensis]
MTNLSVEMVSKDIAKFQELPSSQQPEALQIARELDLESGPMNFGQDVQERISSFANDILGQMKQNNMVTAGQIMNELLNNLTKVEPDELSSPKKGLLAKWFSKSPSIHETLSKYQKVGAQMEKTSVRLRRSRESLLEDNEILEQLYQQNESYYEDIRVLLAAGELKKATWLQETLPRLKEELTKNPDDFTDQKVRDLDTITEHLEQRLYDLEISQQIAMQTAPQIRMIQKGNQRLADHIQSSVLTTLPIWKHQISIALSHYKQQEASKSQRNVNRKTDELFRRTARLYQSSLQSNPHNQQSLHEAQREFIETIQQTIHLQQTETEQRKEAEHTLASLSGAR